MLWLLFLSPVIFFSSCSKEESPPTDPENFSYSFFVAGHTYGTPLASNLYLHPPFKEFWESIRQYPEMQMGFFTGDIVRNSTPDSWDSVDSDVAELDLPVYFTPGNHDIGDRDLYESRYGDPENGYRSYRWFTFGNDLFVLLDSELSHWNIDGEQLLFLEDVLSSNGKDAGHIFVFFHALIWWNETNIFKNIVTNWPPLANDSSNYWAEVEPLLRKTNKPVFLFAGDLCANPPATPYMYYQDGSITYIASGMGNLIDDNFVYVRVSSEGEVSFELIALQGDPHRLSNLEDYLLP